MNQLEWLSGREPASRRDGYIYWMGPEMYGVKWRNFKLALVVQKFSTDPVGKLSSPRIINLIADPQEREPLNVPHLIPGQSRTSIGSWPSSAPVCSASHWCLLVPRWISSQKAPDFASAGLQHERGISPTESR